MTTDDERAQKIAEAKARAEAARSARAGGTPATPPATTPADAAPTPADAAPTPTVIVAASEPTTAPPAAAPVEVGGADDRARKIAEAKARAEAARAGRTGGAAPAPATAEATAPPVAAAAESSPVAAPPAVGADDRARRIEEAKARAAAARAGGAPPAERPANAPEPVGAGAAAAGAAPAAGAPARAVTPTRATPPAAMAPAGDWKGVATAPSRVITARADTGLAVRREMQTAEVQNLMTRRSLVRSSFWAALGVTLAGLALGFVQFFWPRQVTGFGGIFKISATAVPKPGEPPKRFPEGKLYLVNLEPGGGVPPAFTGVAAPSAKGGLLALWQKCPHLGCTVPWRGDFDFEGVKGWFRCPCHGSTYTQAGIRVFGPAPRPMDTFALKVNGDGSVDVDTSKVTRGAPDNPQRAVLA